MLPGLSLASPQGASGGQHAACLDLSSKAGQAKECERSRASLEMPVLVPSLHPECERQLRGSAREGTEYGVRGTGR